MSTLLFEPRQTAGGEPVIGRLLEADRIIQRERALRFLARAVPWVCGAVLALFAADVALHWKAGPRLIADAVFLLGLLGVLARAAFMAWRHPRCLEAAARVLEERNPALGSRLINLLQLRAQANDPGLEPLTRAMAAQAVDGYAREVERVDFVTLAHSGELRREVQMAGAWLGGFLLVTLAAFDLTRTEVPRFLDPLGDHPPYSFTRLEIVEPARDGTSVVYGQSLLVTARVGGHRPGELFLTAHPPGRPEEAVTVPMFDKGERGFSQQLENIRSELVLFVHTKNRHSVSRQRRVGVILTPRLEKAFVKITPPAYTALPLEERPLSFKNLKALAGSTLEFRLVSNRPLREGKLEIIASPENVQPVPMKAGDGNGNGEPNEVRGTMTVTDPVRLRFSLTDRDGFASQETWELSLTVTHDLPPEVQITHPNNDSFVAMDFKLDAIIEASDDYGLAILRIHQAINNVWSEPRTVHFEKPPRHARDGLHFDFATMGLKPGDTVSFFAEAIDNAPGEPHLARSRVITLTVITPEQYNEFLREQLDMADIQAKYADLIHRMRDAGEQQKKLGAESEAMRRQLEQAAAAGQDDKTRAALQRKLDGLLAKQSALNGELEKLAGEMENFVRDQPLYDIESELGDTLKKEAQNIRESAKANDAQSKDIADRSSPAEGGRQLDPKMLEDFQKAAEEQAQKLGATAEQTQQEVVEPLAEMSQMHEIVKDLNRFKELYEAQERLAQHAQAYDRSTPLNREDQLALKDLAAQEKAIGDELDAVEQKLWEDGKAAEEKFPKAGQSAKDIAQKMGDARLQMHANNATDAMLSGQGDKGAQLSARMRDEMQKLFSQCQSKGGQMSQELDHAMGLSRGMKPGNSFQQMMKSRKFGSGKAGFGTAPGQGSEGADGFAVTTGPNAHVLGNESAISHDSQIPGTRGHNQGKPGFVTPETATDPGGTARNLNPVNRESDAVQGETAIDQYSDVVEKYFKAITK